MRLIILAALALATPARAVDIPVTTTISEVTVYRQQATVMRRGAVSIPAGDHRLILRGLPGDIDAEQVRLTIASPGVQMGALDFERVTENNLVSAEERALVARQQNLQDQIASIDDDVAAAQLQLRILDGLAATAPAAREPAVTGANLPTALAAAGTGALAARAKIRDAQGRRRGVQEALGVVQTELAKVVSTRRTTTEIRVTVRAEQAVANVAMSVDYGAGDASWNPVYTAQLDSQAAKLALVEQARVQQGSGENWNGVALTLRSGSPSDSMAAPPVASLFVDLEAPAPPEPRARKAMMAPAPAVPDTEAADIVVTGTRIDQAEVAADTFAVDTRIPGRVSIASDREPRLFPVSTQSWDVKLRTRAAPRTDRAAYVEALFQNNRPTSIRGGAMQVFRDGSFAGTVQLATILPGADARLPMGADERIRIVVRDEAEQSGKTGTLSKRIEAQTRVRFEVTSYRDTPVDIDIVDVLPVSRNRDVEVETLKGATPPSEINFGGRDGVLVWRLTLQPRQTATIRHAYVVRYPRGMVLTQERSE